MDCARRANTTLGSSKNWPETYSDRYEGSYLFVTPPFDSYTVVFAMYCDGGSWTGNVSRPVHVSSAGATNTAVYYRGRLLLDALLQHLLRHARGAPRPLRPPRA